MVAERSCNPCVGMAVWNLLLCTKSSDLVILIWTLAPIAVCYSFMLCLWRGSTHVPTFVTTVPIMYQLCNTCACTNCINCTCKCRHIYSVQLIHCIVSLTVLITDEVAPRLPSQCGYCHSLGKCHSVGECVLAMLTFLTKTLAIALLGFLVPGLIVQTYFFWEERLEKY